MKFIYLLVGFISFVIGLVGVVIPILPTTPFMLLTSFCLLKSSRKLNERFMKTKFYKVHVKPFKEKRGMKLKSKLLILIPVSIMLLCMFILIDSNIMRGIIVILFTVKLVVFLRIKTLKEEAITYDEQEANINK